MTRKIRITALALVLAALAVVPAATDVRAHSPGGASLTALTVTAGGAAQTLSPTFSSTVTDYTVAVANTVTQITIVATPDGDGTVAYQDTDGTALTDADTNTAGQQVDLPTAGDKSINVVVTHGTDTQTYTVLVSREVADDPCAGGGYNPTPTPVEVEAVPIVVTSSTDDYFVLYVSDDLDTDTEVDLPVLVKKGEAGTTTLAENIKALPKERYRVDKYLVADPADVDGDCIDDITELEDLGTMNPVNPAPNIELIDGAVAIPDQDTLAALSQFPDFQKIIVFGMAAGRPGVYFLNTETHPRHSTFLDAVGLEEGQAGVVVGGIVRDRELVASDGSRGVYYFWLRLRRENSFNLVARLYTLLAASMPLLTDNLAYKVPHIDSQSSPFDLPLYRASRINLVFDAEIHRDVNFLSLNQGEGYGLLRIMDLDDRPNPRDVVIYEALPNELPRVAGIISTVPQTPLSHVNLRAIQDGVPNAFIRDALDNTDIDDLIDSYVHYTVTEDGWTLAAATPAEVDAHYASSRPSTEQTPQRDLSITEITPLSEVGFEDWTAFGVKAANVAVLGTLEFPAGTVPDGFAIPFYLYDEFMKHNGFYTRIETMLADEDFQTDFETKDDMLDDLRDDIEDAETPEWILTALEEMNEGFPEGINRRYRSSTNNEDLPGFNGAGLYDSKSQKPSEDEEDLAKSLKEVYASLWNFRAFTERDFYRIDHLAAAMGILVHPSYRDELLNGVAVSFDPIDNREHTYYVNSQVGEDLVTNPDAHSVPEELLLHQLGYTVLATSNQVPAGQLLMSDAHLTQLRQHLTVIHDHFKGLYNPAADEPFAMEIEFKITSDNVLAIKQARPWVFSDSATVTPPPTNQAPAFTDGASTTRSVARTATPGVDIGAPVAATDDDNDILTYSLDVASQASFDIVSTTGQLQTKAALDFETGPNSYSVTVTAADPSSAEDTITVTITVDDVDDPGTVTLSKVQPIVGDVLTATVRDDDTIQTSIDWQWERSSDQTNWTVVSGNLQGQRTSLYPPLADDVGRYLRATASYADGFGAGKSAQVVSVNRVQAAPEGQNNRPLFLANESGLRDVDENTPAGVDIGAPVAATDGDNDTLTYTLGGTDADSFDIDRSSGQLRTKAALDFETLPNSYSVIVTATDTAGATDLIPVTITVNNVDEPGSVMLSSQQPLVGIPLTATLHDPDVVVPGSVAWLWERSPDGVSDWTPISREIVAIYTPVADDVSDYLRATASYTDYEGFDTKSVQAISTNAVDPEPGRNPPMLTEHPTATRSILRNTPAGTDIGEPFTATDADNDALTYSLGGPDGADFGIDASSGQLRTKGLLTGITRTSYTVFVSVSDGRDDQGMPEADRQIDTTTVVTITVTTPRSSGGGGGGGFGAGPGEVQLVIAAAVAGEEAPAGQRFGFAFECTPPDGEPQSAWTFSLGAGQASGRFVPGKIPCSLTVTDDGGADAVDGLFTDRVLGEEALRLVVTFTYGIVTTAVALDAETVVEDGGVSLTIPAGSRDAPYSVLLETDSESCEAALDLEGESIACHTVTVFDADGAEETGVTLLVPATITITLDAAQTEALGGIDGVRAARQRGELRMLQRDDAESPWQEIPFTVGETDEGGVQIVVSVQQFSDFSLITAPPRLQTIALHAGWTVVVWDGADGASIPNALGDIAGQVDVIYQWLAETQTWRSHRPAGPAILSAFDTFERGASYWIQSSDAVEWTVVGGPLEPPAAEPIRLHSGWTEVVWRGADGAALAEAFGADVFPQVEVIYRWLGETQTWGSFRPGAPAFLNAFDTFASGGSYWIAVAEEVEWMVGPDGG